MEHVLAEVDRQLNEQRSHADSLATRSGIMIAAVTLVAGVLSSGEAGSAVSGWAPWMVGGAAGLGVVVMLMGRLVLGPTPSKLISMYHGKTVVEPLLLSKVIAIEVNAKALTRTEVILTLQALATVASGASLIFYIVR